MKARSLINEKISEDLKERPHIQNQKDIEEFMKERFNIFIGLVLSTMNGTNDANKYEDISRFLLGRRAYLLFAFEKVVAAVLLSPNHHHNNRL